MVLLSLGCRLSFYLKISSVFDGIPESVCPNAGSVNLGKIGLYDQAGQERLGLQ